MACFLRIISASLKQQRATELESISYLQLSWLLRNNTAVILLA